MRSRPDSTEDAVHSFCRCLAVCVLLSATASLSAAQETPHAPFPHEAMVVVPRAEVPDVRTQRLEGAQAILQRSGFQLGAVTTSPGPGRVGTVWQQEPQEHTVAPRGTRINLVLVSLPRGQNPIEGDEQYFTSVPRLTGLTRDRASTLLELHRLLFGNVSTGNGNGREGTIYAQEPREGTTVKIGSRIDVQIVEQQTTPGSTEPVWVFVPNVLGQTQQVAEETLSKYGLSRGRVSAGGAAAPVGTVFAQFPAPNSRVPQGTPVNLRIAQAPQNSTVTVPDLLRRDVESAKVLLAQLGLQPGEVTSEESDNTPNSVVDQSPVAGTKVERGTLVNLVLAQPIPMVSVPAIVQQDEAEAKAMLASVGLQLGSVGEKYAEASSGTVLEQKPAAGNQVRKGTAVDVIVSRQVILSLTMDQANPTRGKTVGFYADLEPPERGVKYRFTFGDGKDSGWVNASKTTHVYQKAGDFQVEVSAGRGDATIAKDTMPVHIPSTGIVPTLIAGVVVLGGGAYFYRGRRLFRKWIRVVPKMSPGTQQLSVENSARWDQPVRIRLVPSAGQCTVWLAGQGPGKGETP